MRTKGAAMSRLSGALAVVLCGFAIVGPAGGPAQVRPGEVDRGFGEGGEVVQRGPEVQRGEQGGPYGEDMAVGPEDSIFALQSYGTCTGAGCTVELYVQRFLPDGALDPSFGEGGWSSKVTVTTPSDSLFFYGEGQHGSIAVNANGEPVVATMDGGDVTLFKVDRSGKLAGDFGGGDGIVTTDFGDAVGKPQLAVAGDGRIVVATGFRHRGDRRFVILARYEPSGVLDPSFGAGASGTEAAGWTPIKGSRLTALALVPAGGIALAGDRCCSPAARPRVYMGWRRADGRPAAPFTRATPWRYLKIGRRARVTSVVALSRGRVYLVGDSYKGVFAARILRSGRLDRTFGRSGVAWLKGMFGDASPAVADRAGRLYVAGHRSYPEDYVADDALVARLTRSGRRDRRWGDDPAGYSLLPFSIGEVRALAFQSSGKLVVFGEQYYDCIRSCTGPAPVLTRLFTGSAPPRR
jgi:uncharacterized delta-60 repeat protein